MVHVATFGHNTWNFFILINDDRHYIQNIILQICNHCRGISLEDPGPPILISKMAHVSLEHTLSMICEM
ncbi:hypothetical protein P8452_03135 [Trifolium repens]|nr:hypothetical protein P8452_03135 [Trifolium repens]